MTVEKVPIITAGGSGMGAEIACFVGADGFKGVIPSSSGKGDTLATELGGTGVAVSNLPSEKLKRLVDSTVGKWARVDGGVTRSL